MTWKSERSASCEDQRLSRSVESLAERETCRQPRTIPNPNRLVKGGRDDKILLGMELSAHGVMVVACHGAKQGAVLPVPYPNGLVVTGTDDPRKLVVEEDGADIVEVPI